MSGNAGIRGYLFQTLITVLDSLVIDNEWDSLTMEPNIDSDKIDIAWYYATKGETKVTQIKSSQNQISESHVKKWCQELQTSIAATLYELILIGPCSQGTINMKRCGEVDIPTPKVLDLTGMIEQAAHRLDRYLESKGLSRTPPYVREILVSSLVTKFETYATGGTPISRSDLHQLVSNWLLALYPPSVNEVTQMQCDVLVDSIVFVPPSKPGDPFSGSLGILLPLTFVNNGVRTAIIEWIAIKVESDNKVKLYTPLLFVDYEKLIQGRHQIHGENIKSEFSQFAIRKDSEKELCIYFTQEPNDPIYPFNLWTSGHYSFKIYVKYQETMIPLMQKMHEFDVPQEIINTYFQGNSTVCSSRKIMF